MRFIRMACAVVLALALFPAISSAADQAIWATYMAGGKIRSGDLGGVAKRDVSTGEASPEGVAIDAAAGKVYWASYGGNAIRVANLDGTGARNLFASESGPTGITFDAAAGRLYWTNYGSGAIRTGKSDGTGAANVTTGESQPSGIALDRSAGKLYWGQYGPGKVRVISLAGGGATDVVTAEPYVTGVAVDPAAGRLYWTNEFAGVIRTGALNGSGARNLIPSAGAVGGIAIDPGAGKIYWAAYDTGTVRSANLDGSGTIQNLITGETSAFYVAILRVPAPAAPPQVSGGTTVGAALTCGAASWAPDIAGGHVYRAPASLAYSWLKDGEVIGGATTQVYTAFAPGTYSCVETATNGAGSTPQTSAPHAVAAIVVQPPPGGGGTTPIPLPTKLKALKAGYDIFYAYNSKSHRNVPTRFKFSQLPSGAKVDVGCSGKGCPFKHKTAKFKGSKANLLSVVKRARLAKGAYLEVKTSAPGYITEVLRFVAAGSKGATLKRLCLPPGVKKPQKC